MASGRYEYFITDGARSNLVPFVAVPKQATDYYIYYEKGKSRLDKISYDYYGNPNYGWIILQANPNLDGLEFNIEDKTLIRVPYPLDTALTMFQSNVKVYQELYGKN